MSRHGHKEIERIKRVAAKMEVRVNEPLAHSLHRLVSSDREQLIRLASRAAYVLAHDYRTTTVGTREIALDDLRLEYNNTVEHLKAPNDQAQALRPEH